MSQAKPQIEDEVIQSLQQQLANAFLLYANYNDDGLIRPTKKIG